VILLDTCALIWTLSGAPVSASARREIRRASLAGELYLSPISAWEIGMLCNTGRLTLHVSPEVYVQQAFSAPGVRIADLTPEIAVRSAVLPGSPPKDPADRILIATARVLGVPIVTRDRRIRRYGAAGHVAVLEC
jgi:PIN domain nuclease of toxin-antitoxin system